MLPTSKRRAALQPLPLPATTTSANRHHSTANAGHPGYYTYKDKDTLKRTHRKPITLLVVAVGITALLLLFSFAWALVPPNQKRTGRTTQGSKVVARDWEHALRTKAQGSGGALVDEHGVVIPARTYNETVLVSAPSQSQLPESRRKNTQNP